MFARRWECQDFICLCPEICSLGFVESLPMTVFCLKNSNLKFLKPTFAELSEYWNEKVAILMLSMEREFVLLEGVP
jgi:hypothetical protein